MADKKNNSRNKQWMSLVTPTYVKQDDDEVQAPLSSGSAVNADGEELNDAEPDMDADEYGGVDMGAASLSSARRVPLSTPMGNPQVGTTSVVDQAGQRTPQRGISPRLSIGSSSIPSQSTGAGASTDLSRQMQLQVPARINPLLSGNVDTEAFAREAIGEQAPDDENALSANLGAALGTGQSMGRFTPRTAADRLLDELSNTNQTPRSLWKRLLIGATRGAAGVNAQDTGASALGKVLGGAGAQAIPQVDVAQQREAGKAKAIERYKIESAVEDRQIKQEQAKAQQARADATQRLSETKFKQQMERERTLNDARLKGQQRQQANDLLSRLEKTPKDDPARKELVSQLDQLGVKGISENYGVKPEKERTAYDPQTGNYIRLQADGTPIIDPNTGQPMIATLGPANREATKFTKEEAELQVAPLNEGAMMNQAINEAKKQFSKDRSKKSDIANMQDNEILADEDFAPWVKQRFANIRAEMKANRDQEINRLMVEGRAAKQGTKQAPKQGTKVAPTKEASSENFDARSGFDANKYKR